MSKIVEWWYLEPEKQVPILNEPDDPDGIPVTTYNYYYNETTPDTVEDNIRLANERTSLKNTQFLIEDTGKVHVVWPGEPGKRRQSSYPDMDTALTAVLVQR